MASIDIIDEFFIARHVLAKLGIPIRQSSKHALHNELSTDEQAALSEIEKLEKTWSFVAQGNAHSFGRKEKNEKIGFWSVPRKSAMVMKRIIELAGYKNVLEVGTSAAFSTIFLANAAKCANGTVHTIELLQPKIDLAKKHISKSGLSNITLLEGEASQILSNWKGPKIDLVFLDADKENYGKYLNLLVPIMNKNGMIIADNINDYGHMMEDYLQKVTGTHLPKSRCDPRVKSFYLAALDNGLMCTKIL